MAEYNTPAPDANTAASNFDFWPAAVPMDGLPVVAAAGFPSIEGGGMVAPLGHANAASRMGVDIGRIKSHSLVGLTKKHTCTTPGCQIIFQNGRDLEQHALTTKHKAFQCQCNLAYTKRSSLDRHVKESSDLRPYSCPFCNKGFKRPGHIHNHLLTVHKKSPEYVRALLDALPVSGPELVLTTPALRYVGPVAKGFSNMQDDPPMMAYDKAINHAGWGGGASLLGFTYGHQPSAFAASSSAPIYALSAYQGGTFNTQPTANGQPALPGHCVCGHLTAHSPPEPHGAASIMGPDFGQPATNFAVATGSQSLAGHGPVAGSSYLTNGSFGNMGPVDPQHAALHFGLSIINGYPQAGYVSALSPGSGGQFGANVFGANVAPGANISDGLGAYPSYPAYSGSHQVGSLNAQPGWNVGYPTGHSLGTPLGRSINHQHDFLGPDLGNMGDEEDFGLFVNETLFDHVNEELM